MAFSLFLPEYNLLRAVYKAYNYKIVAYMYSHY